MRFIGYATLLRAYWTPFDVLIQYLELVQQGDRIIETRKEILKKPERATCCQDERIADSPNQMD